MANLNGSEAYDLSLFEPREPKLVALKPNKKAEKEAKRRTRIQSFFNTALTLLSAAAVVAVVGLMIASRIRLTEMNSEISRKQAELNQVISETKRLESELASRTSAQSVEAYAKENGMQKMEPGQVAYITVEIPDDQTGENGREETGFWESIWNTIVGFFSGGNG